MEANDFVANLKANGAEKDNCDLAKSFIEYTEILRKLSAKDKNSFSLNVLCILCRNLEKVPTWRDRINNKDLLRLGIECVRNTRTLEAPEQVKTLACVYHLHKYVVKQSTSIPPELILKLSFMPFEYDSEKLLKEYCKTYWSIIVDRLTYIEKLKTKRMPVTKLLPKLIDDIVQVIKIYDTVQFTINLLLFLVKKLYFIYSDISTKELNEAFGKIFDGISKKDLKQFKSLSEKDTMDLYVKLNDCLYIVTENALKNDSKDSVLDTVTRICITLVGHRSDMFHCLQTLYSNSFCFIFKDKIDINLIDNTFNNLLVSCEMTEKLGYDTVICATYPFISQLLRLFIENSVNKNIFNENSIENCLKLISLLLEKLRNTNQLLKCENCNVKSGLHDALRLSFHIKHFIAITTNQKLNINNILPTYYELVEKQYLIINELRTLGCVNQEKCFRKLQTDVHNTAITLNKAQCYEYSIKLFDIYLRNELKYIKNDVELKNISRALYNKSICELDFKLYEDSLKNAYLSLVFSLPEGLSSEKFMSLVMDIKAKTLKSLNEEADNENNSLQTMTILDICKLLYDDNLYGNLKPIMKNLEFSVLLKHEFSMYVKLWPSITPIAGVWKSMYDLINEKHPWVKLENKEILQWTLFEIVLETPSAVRTIHDECYRTIVKELLVHFEKSQPSTIEEKIVSITLLFLQAEYDLAEASQKYGWKIIDHTVDPDQAEVTRTVEQEHRAVSLALRATHELTDALPTLKTVKPSALIQNALQVYQVFVHQFLFLQRTLYGLQLAYVCCHIADVLGDKEAYVHNAGLLVYHSGSKRKEIDEIITKCMKYVKDLMNNEQSMDTALNYLCEVAIYYTKTGSIGVAAKLVQTVQVRLLRTQETHPHVDCK
ncbi:unnamed protein product [Euphydryas editha]|uniref:Uncharacterized protein n=1 Tax=Euphydryas editha TaxID=104508 RepID=A0AAU9UNN1_EUPED|nr:unnamed protein product [Euphydryas editha]